MLGWAPRAWGTCVTNVKALGWSKSALHATDVLAKWLGMLSAKMVYAVGRTDALFQVQPGLKSSQNKQ
jgi:hypothetical protein